MSTSAVVPQTVLARATTKIPVANPGQTMDQVRRHIVGNDFDSVVAIPVCAPDKTLVGVLGIETVLAAAPTTTVAEVMDRDPVRAHRDTDQEVAAWELVQRQGRALTVVDDAGRLLGVVTPTDMLQVVFAEHEEDLSRLAGVVHDQRQVRTATIESVRRRVLHRIPWLLIGLLGAMLSAFVVSGYEDAISRQVVFAFFLPAVVYMADAVGTQTETVVVRGLSVGVGVRQVAPKEAFTGLLIGTLVAVLFVPLGLLVFGDFTIMLAVAVALFVSCALASLVAMVLPYWLDRLGRDPAYGSGPLATVVQDLLTIICYCAIVSAVV